MRRWLVVLAAVALPVLLVTPAGGTEGWEPTLVVTKTVLDAQGNPLTTLPDSEFRVDVSCTWAQEGKEYEYNDTVVFDEQGVVISHPDGWQGLGETYSWLTTEWLAYAHCSVTEDPASSALESYGVPTVTYACDATAEPLWGDDAEGTDEIDVEFGCTSDQSGQFTVAWDGDACAPEPTEVTEGGREHDWCKQVITLSVTNSFEPPEPAAVVVVAPKFPG